ncbi:MAG: hypothetical protein QXF96_06770 [Saccharolobus sp.]
MVKKEIVEIEPWGVNVPYILLALIYWTIGSFSVILGLPYHPYFMLIGAYALYFGMIQRLFFPAKKYIALHILSLIFLAIPFYYFQILATITLILTEIWGLRDVKGYGGRFPINALVLSSPFASLIAWLLYPNFWALILPLLIYVLGVNIGVFTANLNTKPVFGIKQIPIFVIIILSYFFPIAFSLTGLVYFLTIYRKSMNIKNISAFSTLLSIIIIPLLSLYFKDYIHAFTLGIMSPLFFSCITYSTSRYNYNKVFVPSILSALSYVLRDLNLLVSGILWVIGLVFFIYLIKDNFYFKAIQYGLSMKFLKPQLDKKS